MHFLSCLNVRQAEKHVTRIKNPRSRQETDAFQTEPVNTETYVFIVVLTVTHGI